MLEYSSLIHLWPSFIAGLAIAVASALLGIFMVMKNMALVSDALSHVALPGIALGLILGINPFWGAFAFLFAAVFLIIGIERRTNLPTDAIVGVLFTASLAIGILLTPEPEVLEALFGDIAKVAPYEALLTAVASLVVIITTLAITRPILFQIVAPDLGHVSKTRARLAYLVFLLMVALIVALGVKFVGTLLMGTLTILPAASAKNIARSFVSFAIASIIFAILSVVFGMFIAITLNIVAGPAVILAGVGIFLLTLFGRAN